MSDEALDFMLSYIPTESAALAKKRKKVKKIPGCTTCPLSKNFEEVPVYKDIQSRPFGPIRESENEKVVVILIGRPYSSKEILSYNQRALLGELTQQLLPNANKIYLFPVIKCPHLKDPTKNMVTCCEQYLRKELVDANPDMIICLGKSACVPFGLDGQAKEVYNHIYEVGPIKCGDKTTKVCKLIATEPIEKITDDPKFLNPAKSAFRQANRQISGEGTALPDNYYLMESPNEFEQWVNTHLTDASIKTLVHAFDIESNGRPIHPKNQFEADHPPKLRCISFSWDAGHAICVPYEEDPEHYYPILKRFMESDIQFIGHNVSFDYFFLKLVNGITPKRIVGDTMNMAFLCGYGGYAGLKPLAAQLTDLGGYEEQTRSVESKVDEDGNEVETAWEIVSGDSLYPYNAADSDCTLRIYKIFIQQIREQQMLPAHWIMTKALITLGEMEHNGMHVNREWVDSAKDYMQNLLVQYKDELKSLANGHEYDWNSPQEMEHVLYDLFLYKVPIVEETGKPIENDDYVVDSMNKEHRPTGDVALSMINTPFTQALRKYRKASKLLSTYFDGYLSNTGLDSCLRARYNLTGTATGRLSSGGGSAAVNMQNLPSSMAPTDPGYEDLHDYKIKKAFTPREKGWVMVNLDQSQLELRLAGAVSKEPLFIESYKAGIDLHSRNAKVSFLLKTPDKELKETIAQIGLKPGTKEFNIELTKRQCKYVKANFPDRRQAAKTISFGVLYGMGPYGLHMTLGNDARNNGVPMQFTVDDCKDMINNFNKGYPTLAKWQAAQVQFARKNGYVLSPFGRRRYLPNINNNNDFREKAKDERRAKNTIVQGAGSDVMQCGIIEMHERLDPAKYKLVCTVHDSVVCEVREDYVDEFIRIAKECLEHPHIGKIEVPLCKIMPFVAEAEVGPSYGELEEYKYPYNKESEIK